MADVFINATDWLISIDPASAGTFKVVACLTGNKMTTTLSDINFSSKCGNLFQPGSQYEASFEGEAFAIDQTGTPSKESYSELYALYTAKTQFPARFGKSAPGSTDHYFYGVVYIDKMDIDAPWNAGLKFNVSFKATVPPFAEYTGY